MIHTGRLSFLCGYGDLQVRVQHAGRRGQPGRGLAARASVAVEPTQDETYLGEKFQKFPNAPDTPLSGKGPEAGKPARSLRLKELDHVAVEAKNLPRMKR